MEIIITIISYLLSFYLGVVASCWIDAILYIRKFRKQGIPMKRIGGRWMFCEHIFKTICPHL